MRLLLLLSVLSFVEDSLSEELVSFYYHESFGIKEAANIKASEEAKGFDGTKTRIVGGVPARLGLYPHLGGLIITLNNGRQSVCGSSLISDTKLVTAAHCWFDGRSQASQVLVVLGSITLFSGGTRVNTSDVTTHEQWNPRTLQNDIAVISIDEVAFSSAIHSISLPFGSLLSDDFAGWWAQAAGFGVQRDLTGITVNQTLHHVSLRVLTNVLCRRSFGSIVTDSVVCTDGSGGRGSCGGDSGGPVQVNSGGVDVLIGIISFGSTRGCESGLPAGSTRVTAFATWIRDRL